MNLIIEYIFDPRNKVANDLLRIMFDFLKYSGNFIIITIKQKLDTQGLFWI